MLIDPSTATAWATFGLLVVTAIYAFLTWRLSVHAKTSAQASQTAAEEAKRAANASSRSAAVAEAQILRDFEVSFGRTSKGHLVVMLRPVSFNAFVHQVDLKLLLVPDSDGSIREAASTTSTTDGPLLIHAGDMAPAFLKDTIAASGHVMGQALVTYSLSEDGERFERMVSVGAQPVEDL